MKIAFNPSTVAALTTPPNNKDITFDLRGRNIFARGVKFCGTDTNTWRDIKINNVSIGSNILDLRNGSNTTLTNTNGVVTINSTWRPVVDNLTSDSTTSSLSANQGRVLAGLINTLSTNISNQYALRDGSNATGRWRGGLACFDVRNTNYSPHDLNMGLELLFLRNTTNNLKDGGEYNGVFSFRQWASGSDWSGGKAHQLSFTDNGNIWHRTSSGDDSWGTWKKLVYSTDIPSSLKNPYSLTTFGIVYDGSAAKTVTTSTFISQVNEATSTVTDGTMFITSWASNNGFADTNAVNVPYKRKAIHLWEYIKAKTDSLYATKGHNHDDRYLKLTGGTMSGTIYRNSGGSTISGRDHAIIRQTYAPGGSSWNPIACVDTETGTWTLGHLSSGDSDTNFHFCFSTNADYNAGNNNGNYVTLRNKVGTIALLSEIPDKNSWNYDDRYLKLTGGTMNGNARIGHGSGNLYIGNSGNDGWLAVQDICSQDSIGDGKWSIRVDGTASFQRIKFPSNRLIAQVSNGSNSPLKGIKLPYLENNGIGIFSRVGNSSDEGGIVLSEDTCVIYNSFDTGWGLSVRDTDINQTDISGNNTIAFGVDQNHKVYSLGGFTKNGSSDSYVLLGGGGHQTISSLSVNHASFADYICSGTLPTPANNTVKAYKDSLAKFFNDIHPNVGVGANVNVSESIISHWSNDSATFYNSSTYCFIKIGGAYAGATYGQFLLSSYNLSKVGIVGRNSSQWSKIKWLAYEDQIPTDNNQLANGAGYITSAGSCAYATSAGNADTLDGLDSTKFLRQVVVPNNTENDFNTFSNMTLTGRVDPTTGASLKNAPWSGSGPGGGYGVLTYLFNGSAYGTQMAWEYGSNRIYIRNRHWGGSGVGLAWKTSWDKLALTTDIPSSLKNPYALTLKANGTTLAIYDGSSVKEANFTYANVGAASASHTHTAIVAEDLRSKYPGQILDPRRMKLSFLAASTLGIKNDGSYYDVITVRSYADSSGGSDNALLFSKNSNSLYHTRFAFGSTSSWGSPLLIIDSGNIGSQSVAYASKAGSVAWASITGKPSSFTPSAHNHSWVSITDKIVAGNEFNIVNAGFNNRIWFNYLPINDRSKTATISGYNFGNGATGYTTIKASGFIKNGSSSSYVLLGDGGHKTISSLSVNYASSAGNADTLDGTHLNGIFTAFGNNGHNITATIGGTTKSFLVNWATYSDKLDGYHASDLLTSVTNTNNGISVTVGGTTKSVSNISVNYANSAGNADTAQYLRSLGNQNCQTGRTQNYGDVYTYNTYDGNTGSPTTFTSVIGFGRGIAGTVEIAGGWDNTNLYWRSLRDCCEDWHSWRTVLDSSNYTEFINNYYWANVKISASSSTTTSPTVHTLTATRVCAGHNPGIDNSISCSNWFRSSGATGWYNTTYNGGWYMSDTSWIRAHNGVGIYTSGKVKASGFHHVNHDNDDAVLLAGGSYKTLNSIYGGDSNHPVFLGYLNLDHGSDGTVSSSFYCLGYSVPFTYTRGGNYCKISIPDTTHQAFYIKAATASVNYSGGGMDTWTGNHRGAGAWWLHCYAPSSNEVRVKGFHLKDTNNDSWWGGNPLWSDRSGVNRITVCIFGYVTFR